MGYSHSFFHTRDIARDEWRAIKRDFKALLDDLPDRTDTAGGFYADAPLKVFKHGEPQCSAVVSDKKILFDGAGKDRRGEELDHDTMALFRRRSDAEHTLDACCKTARKPYDLLVCALLIVAARRAPGALRIGTNGEARDWEPAAVFVHEVLGLRAWPRDLEDAGIRVSDLTRPVGLRAAGEPVWQIEPDLARLGW